MHRNGFAPSTTLVILCENRDTHTVNMFKNGNLEITRHWDVSNKFSDAIQEIGEYIPFNKQARFVEAFLITFLNEDYSHKRMIAKLEYLSGYMKKCPDTKSHLEQLEYVYNYKSRNKIRLNMRSDQY
jgi:hypothetical protein